MEIKNITKIDQIVYMNGNRLTFRPDEIKEVGDNFNVIPGILVEVRLVNTKVVEVVERPIVEETIEEDLAEIPEELLLMASTGNQELERPVKELIKEPVFEPESKLEQKQREFKHNYKKNKSKRVK